MRLLPFIVAVACTSSFAREPQEYVGAMGSYLELGFKEISGGKVATTDEDELWFLQVVASGNSMLWLTRLVRGPASPPIWEVEAATALPPLRRGQHAFNSSDIDCTFQGDSKAWIFAIGSWTDRRNGVGGYAHHITSAWRIDQSTKRIVPVPPGEVKCELNENRD